MVYPKVYTLSPLLFKLYQNLMPSSAAPSVVAGGSINFCMRTSVMDMKVRQSCMPKAICFPGKKQNLRATIILRLGCFR